MNMLQNVARWYFSRRALPFWVILLLDCLMVVVAAILVAVLVEGPMNVMTNWKSLTISTVACLWCYFTGFRTMHTYSGIIRYSTFVDLQRVGFANIIGLILSLVVRWGLIQVEFVPFLDYVDLFIVSILATAMMWLMRVLVKFVYDMGYNSKRAKRVFIYGVRRGGVSIAKSLRNEELSRYVLAGFVTEDENYIGCRMMGVRVFRNDLNMVEEMKLRGATVLLVSPVYNEKLRGNPELIDRLIEENIHIHMMSQNYEWDGKSDLNHVMLKEVEIEDLLPREKIEIDMDKVGGMLTGKRICEIYVQSLDKAIKTGEVEGVTQFVTTRFGNVLGSNGSVIPLFREQIKNGGPITVTHPDIIRYFMLIPEACKLVLEAGTMGNGGEIYIFDMGKPVRIADLAKRMIRLSGAKHVRVEYTGLRDGEKLFEELLNDTEITKPTHHPKIKIAAVREYAYADAKREEDELYQLSFGYDAMEVVRKMKQIVPEFKSQHSPYEVLDK